MFASSVPLVAESVDLVGELGEVLVGTALVVLDDPQQALTGIEQALEDGSARAAPSLMWCSMRIRVPSFRQTAPSAPMAHCSPL